MTPPNNSRTIAKQPESRTASKSEVAEKAPVPVAVTPEIANVTAEPIGTTPNKKAEDAEKRAFTIMIPHRSYKLLGLIAKVEDKSISEVILDAIERAGLKERAKVALATLSADLGE